MFVPQLWPGTCTGHTPAQDELGRASPPIGSQHTPHPNIFWKFSTALKVCGSCQPQLQATAASLMASPQKGAASSASHREYYPTRAVGTRQQLWRGKELPPNHEPLVVVQIESGQLLYLPAVCSSPWRAFRLSLNLQTVLGTGIPQHGRERGCWSSFAAAAANIKQMPKAVGWGLPKRARHFTKWETSTDTHRACRRPTQSSS